MLDHIAGRHTNGTPSDDLRQVAKALFRAYNMSPQRHEIDSGADDRPSSRTSSRATTGLPPARRPSSWVCLAGAFSGWHELQAGSRPSGSAGRTRSGRRTAGTTTKGRHLMAVQPQQGPTGYPRNGDLAVRHPTSSPTSKQSCSRSTVSQRTVRCGVRFTAVLRVRGNGQQQQQRASTASSSLSSRRSQY